MLYNILRQINWLDIFVIILLARICYVAINTGLPIEIFKILGTLCAIYFSFHYYSSLSGSIQKIVGFKNIPIGFLNFSSFLILTVFSYGIFIILRKIFSSLVKIDSVSTLNKLGGVALGTIRGILLASLLVFIFVISGNGYLKGSVRASYSGKTLFKIAPATYKTISNGFVSKLFPRQKVNSYITELGKKS